MLSDPQKRAAYDQYGHAGRRSRTRAASVRAARARKASAVSPRPSATSSATSSAAAAAARRGGGGQQVYRGSDLQLRDGDHARGSGQRQGNADPHPELGQVRDLPRQRRQARHQRQDLPQLQRRAARCTCARASSASSRPARTATAPARSSPSPASPATARGKVKKQQDARGQDPGRHQRRHAHPLGRQRRAGHQRRPAGRPVHRDPHQAARHLRARRRRPALHGAGAA